MRNQRTGRSAAGNNPTGPRPIAPSVDRTQVWKGGALSDGGRLGAVFPLLLVWTLFELGRPPTPSGVPLVISGVLFLDWLLKNDKQWSRQSRWWLVLLGVTAIGVLFAANTYATAFSTRWMAIMFFGVCLPLQALVTTPKRLRLWVYGFLVVALYANGWAATHGGMGPSARSGGQDENYMAALAGMALPFAYFSLFVEKRLLYRIFFGVVIVICVASIAVGVNPSRGGFLGLCAVALYCLARSPRKWLGLGVVSLTVLLLMAIAGPAFWADIRTTSDFTSGTADVRVEIWKTGIRMWQANPVFGVGAGNFRWVIGDYQTAEQFEKFGRSLGGSIVAHSLPVELLAELGLAGAIATVALVISTWKGLGKVRDAIPVRAADRDLAALRCYADAVRASILAVLVNGVFLSLLYYSHLWLLLALGSALPFVYRRLLGPGIVGEPARPAGRRGGAVRPVAAQPPLPIPRFEAGGRQ